MAAIAHLLVAVRLVEDDDRPTPGAAVARGLATFQWDGLLLVGEVALAAWLPVRAAPDPPRA